MEIQNRQAALCLFCRGDRFLMTHLVDPATGTTMHRPPGGGLEPGETPEQALHREVMEELGVTLSRVRLLGDVHHVWYWKGREVHERVWLYLADAADDPRLARGETPLIIEADGDRVETCWRAVHDPGLPPFCPVGLVEFLVKVSQSTP